MSHSFAGGYIRFNSNLNICRGIAAGRSIVETIERHIVEAYIRDYSIASASYEMMGLMLNNQYVEERIKLFNIENLYIYGGTYMAVQLYVNIKGIVDKSGGTVVQDLISVLPLDIFQKQYQNEKVIVTSIRFFQEIKQDLQQFIDAENILGIGEFLMGLV